MLRTKQIFTLGPATDKPGVLAGLLHTGMDCARFNFSHGSHQEHARRCKLLKSEVLKAGKSVSAMLDLSGPKLRVGRLRHGQVELIPSTEVRLTAKPLMGTDEVIPIRYPRLGADVQPGDRILLDDGLLKLKVLRVIKQEVFCRVETGGLLKDNKGVNLPGIAVGLPALTAKDRVDLKFGLKLGMDYVALSFVRRPEELIKLRKLVRRMGSTAGIIAKIEKPQAIPRLAEIIQAADGVMIARGDLGVEMSPEQVPTLQKRIIFLANQSGCLVITATQMLQSMMQKPTPTRAEASDVANAIFDGTDAVMLSGETAAGLYPRQSAAMMARIIKEAEASPEYNRLTSHTLFNSSEDVVVAAGVKLAEKAEVRALVIFTNSGHTAKLAARQRPRVPVIALAHAPHICRQLQLYWGIQSIVINNQPHIEAVVQEAEKCLLRNRMLRRGEKIVVLASSPVKSRANFLKLHVIGT